MYSTRSDFNFMYRNNKVNTNDSCCKKHRSIFFVIIFIIIVLICVVVLYFAVLNKKNDNKENESNEDKENEIKDDEEEEEGKEKEKPKEKEKEIIKEEEKEFQNDENEKEESENKTIKGEDEKNEVKIFPLEENSKTEVMNIYDNIGENDKGTLNQFCEYLSQKASNLKEEQKVYLAYYWITKNIKYDWDGYESGHHIVNPDDTFKLRTTVCSGYSSLFKRLLLAMNYT